METMLTESDAPIPIMLMNAFVGQALAYFAVVGLLYVVFWMILRERLPRIEPRRRIDRRQIVHELKHTLVTLVVGMSSAGGVLYLHATGRSSLVTTQVSLGATAIWVVSLIAFNDLWFYGWHRLLHTRLLYRHVHVVHHKSVDVNPFTSYSFHAFEAFLLGAWIVPAVAFLPLPMTAIATVQVVGLANNVMSHLGVELLPRWLLRVPLVRLTNTATFHSLHHTKLTGNFGLHTRIWDRLFGTEVPEYEERFRRRGTAEGTSAPEFTRDRAIPSPQTDPPSSS
jgi:sterol desaturase/sphingolipid hydroxylase (fatty acid hydroxylase superfamily)